MTNRTFFLLALVAALALGVTGQSYAKVYASYVRVTQEGSTLPFDGNFADRTGATIRYILNHAADSVVINVVPAGGGASLKRLWVGASVAGDNSMNWDGSQNNGTPTPVGAYKLEITAYHGGFGSYTEYHLSTPAIFTRGVGSVNNPALRYFGFIYTASNGGYVTGVGRHAADGRQWGNVPDSALLTTTGVPVGPGDLRYATTPDQDGYVYLIGLTARKIYRYHLDTLNVAVFDSSAYGMRIQGLDVTGSGANKMLYVTGDSAVFRIPIGTQSFNTIPPTTLARVTAGVRMVFWDAKVGQDSSLYVIYRADSAIVPLPAFSRGILKFNLTTGSLPKTFADTVWSSFYADGDPVTLAMDHGATTGSGDDILYCNTDLRAPNTVLSAIYAFNGLNTPAPTRSIAWLDPDNNCSSARATVATDVLGNLIYFENSNEQVVLVSPPSGSNSYTYTAFDQVSITAAGVTPPLLSIAVAREDLNGDRQPDRLGDTVKVIGVISSTNVQTTNFGYFMQDATAGIHLFQFGLVGAPALRPGDRVEVVGAIAYFRGTTEISPANLATDIRILDTGNVLTPIPLTIGQFKADPETYESRLIQFNVAHPLDFTSAQWPAAGSSANLNIWNGIDTTILRIDSDTEVDGSPYPAFPVRLDGIATQFTSSTTTHNNGYQITPFFVANFVPINYPPLPTFRLLTPVNGSQLEIDSTASYNFTWRRAVDFNSGDVLIYQYKPVAFGGSLSNNAGADTVKTLTGAQLLTYLGTADSLVFRWTVLAKDPPNPPVSTTDTFAVTLRRGLPPPPTGWTVQTSGITTYLYSVDAVSQNVAWAAGAGGRVLRTTNGGTTWTSVGGGNIGTADVYNVDGVSASTAFVTTSPIATYIFRTTNGGTSWDTVYTQAGGFIDAIKMIDATTGVAVGDPVAGVWTIVKTTDGGATWARIATEPAQVGTEAGTQNGLSTVGANHIWFNSGQGGRIYRSTDAGLTWSTGIAPFPATSNVWFDDTQYGVATGSAANAVARSTNGGATWTSVTVAGSGFLIACAGSGTSDFWYARGTTVYRSTDRGATFASSHVGTGTYVGLSFVTTGSNTSGWGVTSTGGIARAYFTITGVDEQPEELPGSFTLLQNYPNPFNPSTTIRYALPKDAFVTLKVYNLLGQEVTSLRDEMQNVGFHDVVWNGRNNAGQTVSSGVYFYRLEARPLDGAEPFTSFKKMLMLK